ncbi:helix-turn-helix transcriptional regulator [Paenibacillus mendelii]|uniref:Helix-turn-helix transcriptional regulator n=1 Tax=Paenibacillus mendelii TaxID=206163 RepID=A0ABV6J6E3_9BACL|nr:YafY family protein [Paenibacillus mendelii]MCQ6561180.1 YafY family transcriptional regulator [Paenibacillus mendelii]
MPKSQRLIQLIMMINAKKTFTVQELADELGLSTRTLTRDLQELSELGVPLYSIQGRGGGYKLLQERLLPPIAFTESEATAMFFACQSLNEMGSLPFDDSAASALHKFYHYLPADLQKQIDRLKNRVMIWNPQRSMSPECLRTLLQAIMNHSVVTIEYSSSSGMTQRNIQPIGLYTSNGYWYCPAYCFLRNEVRQFRADRIRSAIRNESIPAREDIAQQTLLDKPDKASSERISFAIELTPQGVWALESNNRFGPSIMRRDDGSGTATIQIAQEDIRFYSDIVWQLGREAKVVEPAEAVAYIKQKIVAMNQLYS